MNPTLAQPQPRPQRTGLVIAGLMLGLLMASLDNTIVSTAMPTVIAELGGMDIFSWVFSAYLLTSTAFIPIFGKLADLYGKKKFLLFGFVLFLIGSALSATAETMLQLIIYRAIQGLGAAPMMPIAFTMIFELMPPEKRGRMQGLFSAVFGISALAGPTVGAYFTDYVSWHWIFLVNLPIGFLAIFFIATAYQETLTRRAAKIDWLGSLTLLIAIIALLLGLTMGGNEYAWDSLPILALLGGAAVFTVLFLLVERRAEEPVIPLQLFNAGVTSSTLVSFLQGFVMIAAMTYIPLFITGVLGGSATNAGNLLTPMMVAMIVGTTAGGLTMSKLPFRVPMLFSALLTGVSAFFLTQIDATTSNGYMILWMCIMGFSFGPLMPVTMMLIQTSVAREHSGVATSLVSFFRNIGMTIGSSLLAVLVNNQFTSAVAGIPGVPAEQLPSDPQVLMSEQARSALPSDLLPLLQDGLSDGVVLVFLVSTGIAAVMFLLSFLAGKRRLVVPPQGKPTSQEESSSGTMMHV